MEVRRKNVGYVEGGGETDNGCRPGDGRGRRRYVFPGLQGRGIMRRDTCASAHTHTHIFNHTVTQCSGEMRCFKGKEVTFLQ